MEITTEFRKQLENVVLWDGFKSGSAILFDEEIARRQSYLIDFCYLENELYPARITYDKRLLKLLFLN